MAHGKLRPLRPSKKSDVLYLLAKDQEAPPNFFDAIVFDGAAVVHLLPGTNIGTFDEYADNVFIPYILKQLERSVRVDVVWDVYISDSIKASTRERRGKGIRRKVSGENKMPAKWMDILRDESNKQELFAFLSSKIVAYDEFTEGKKVYATSDKSVLPKETDHMAQPCDHEEADTRLLLHLIDALNKGQKSCLVRTVDTDVVVILIGKLHCLLHANADADIWAAFGAGKHFTYWYINYA